MNKPSEQRADRTSQSFRGAIASFRSVGEVSQIGDLVQFFATQGASSVTLAEGLELVEQVLAPKQLNKVQKTVFCSVWKDQSYKEISEETGYTLGHIKDTGSDLWRLLSEATGEKVTRRNFQGVLKWVAINRNERWVSDRYPFLSTPFCELPLSSHLLN